LVFVWVLKKNSEISVHPRTSFGQEILLALAKKSPALTQLGSHCLRDLNHDVIGSGSAGMLSVGLCLGCFLFYYLVYASVCSRLSAKSKPVLETYC